MSLKDEIFTIDNLWHSLVAIGFTCICLLGLVIDFLPNSMPFTFAAVAGFLLYLREVMQVGWQWSLPDKHTGRASLHKHMEWIVGTVAAFITAGIIAGAT